MHRRRHGNLDGDRAPRLTGAGADRGDAHPDHRPGRTRPNDSYPALAFLEYARATLTPELRTGGRFLRFRRRRPEVTHYVLALLALCSRVRKVGTMRFSPYRTQLASRSARDCIRKGAVSMGDYIRLSRVRPELPRRRGLQHAHMHIAAVCVFDAAPLLKPTGRQSTSTASGATSTRASRRSRATGSVSR